MWVRSTPPRRGEIKFVTMYGVIVSHINNKHIIINKSIIIKKKRETMRAHMVSLSHIDIIVSYETIWDNINIYIYIYVVSYCLIWYYYINVRQWHHMCSHCLTLFFYYYALVYYYMFIIYMWDNDTIHRNKFDFAPAGRGAPHPHNIYRNKYKNKIIIFVTIKINNKNKKILKTTPFDFIENLYKY